MFKSWLIYFLCSKNYNSKISAQNAATGSTIKWVIWVVSSNLNIILDPVHKIVDMVNEVVDQVLGDCGPGLQG